MKISDKPLVNGRGGRLGDEGRASQVYARPAQQSPAEDPAELLGQVTKLLGVDSPAQALAAIRVLQEDRKRALASAETAWGAVHNLARFSYPFEGRV